MQFAVTELYDKKSHAWFAIANILYKYKRLPVSRACCTISFKKDIFRFSGTGSGFENSSPGNTKRNWYAKIPVPARSLDDQAR